MGPGHNMNMSEMVRDKDMLRQMCAQVAPMTKMMCDEMMNNLESMKTMCNEMMQNPEAKKICTGMIDNGEKK